MSKSIKLKDNTYWDTRGIMHGKNLLSDIINGKLKYEIGVIPSSDFTQYKFGSATFCYKTITFKTPFAKQPLVFTTQLTHTAKTYYGDLHCYPRGVNANGFDIVLPYADRYANMSYGYLAVEVK